MVNGLLLLLAFITCVGCADSKINLVQNEVSDIIIDPDQVGFDLDISDILVDSIEIIKLETNDNCLIGKIGKISFADQFIFVSDPDVARKLYMFDKSGKFSYISKFHIIISCKLIVYIVMCFYQETN